MGVSVTDRLAAKAIAAAVSLVIGSAPPTVETADSITVTPTPAQADQLRALLEKWMSSAPGTVRVDVMPVLQPLIIKKASPWLLGAGALGGVVGKFLLGR